MNNRREFLRNTLGVGFAIGAGLSSGSVAGADRPNMLWLTCEDIGPELGCYGDEYADTPVLDELASRALLYENFWSTAPVCAPARTTLISGIYPPSSGAEHMRSMTHLPEGFKMYPQYLRESGYYCTNNSKTDYNLEAPKDLWDESSGRAHWKNRKSGQPFFAIFNNTATHESKIRKRPHTAVHDPAKAPLPAYHPDTPEVREDWGQYYDNITTMDTWVGDQLKEIKDAGLAEDTIVFFYGDHGSGMPRSKRWPYNSGLHVALIVYIPEKYKHLAPKEYSAGGRTDRLAGFIDLPATVLSLGGIKPPEQFQGHAFLGTHETEEQPFSYGFRGRMDERYDMVRTVRDKRYHYIKNYMPHKVYGQYLQYMFVTPTTRIWKELYDEGKLNEAQSRFWETKPAEELYDLQNDPDEVNNLAESPKHARILSNLKRAQREWAKRIRDVGFLPEDEVHSRSAGSSPYDMGHDDSKYPLGRIMRMAESASSLKVGDVPKLMKGLSDDDSAVRYWAAMGFLMREEKGVAAGKRALLNSMAKDTSPSVRVIAAEALGRYGDDGDLELALDVLRELSRPKENTYFVAMLALNAIESIGAKAAPLGDFVAALPDKKAWSISRGGGYVQNLASRILSNVGRTSK